MKNVSVWSRSRLEPPFLPGAGADPIWSEPELAPGPRTFGAGAAQESGGSATLLLCPMAWQITGAGKYFLKICYYYFTILTLYLLVFFCIKHLADSRQLQPGEAEPVPELDTAQDQAGLLLHLHRARQNKSQ